ncbi:MAG: hypothetical protein Q4B02_11650 [Propionibacteriaceae bacterium]|jgi:hypothetical protein|nr:hypothetical protein [Propionibacterium sp.]MDO4646415.1 hypothetical protein [Propionibacteriaceae bacterium]
MPSITPQNRDFLETVAVGVVLTTIILPLATYASRHWGFRQPRQDD